MAFAGRTASVPAGVTLVAVGLSPVTLLACALRSRTNRGPLAQHLEAERSGAGDGLDQADIDRVAEPVGKTRILADKGMADFVVDEIFVADGGGRDEPVGTCLD